MFVDAYSLLMPPTELRVYVSRFFKDLQHSNRLLNYNICPTESLKIVVFKVSGGDNTER